MTWEHDVSYDWLVARCSALTATDIKDLLPETATGRPRKITDEVRWKVLSRKISYPSRSDCHSVGYAARGHILEPYAIGEFNMRNTAGIQLFHWDDVLIKRETNRFCLGFSPDALSFPNAHTWPMDDVVSMGHLPQPRILGEVKSYANEKHMAVMNQPKQKAEERWQIATAMAVDPSIEKGILILYNPRMIKEYQLATKVYDRSDLKDEIEVIEGIEDDFLKFLSGISIGGMKLSQMMNATGGWLAAEDECIDDKIEEKEMQAARLNP